MYKPVMKGERIDTTRRYFSHLIGLDPFHLEPFYQEKYKQKRISLVLSVGSYYLFSPTCLN
jgi:hypothetical protein